jgi:transcription antitermination protein NusB
MSANPRSRPPRSIGRAAARLGAVQALYQHHMEATPLARLLDEFHQHRLGAEIEDDQYAPAERAFFDDVVKGTIARMEEIDALISAKLSEDWRIDRLDKTMLQILRCGTYELLARADIPVSAAISEYVDVAHAFFDEKGAKLVNAVLDAVAKEVRAG